MNSDIEKTNGKIKTYLYNKRLKFDTLSHLIFCVRTNKERVFDVFARKTLVLHISDTIIMTDKKLIQLTSKI